MCLRPEWRMAASAQNFDPAYGLLSQFLGSGSCIGVFCGS